MISKGLSPADHMCCLAEAPFQFPIVVEYFKRLSLAAMYTGQVGLKAKTTAETVVKCKVTPL